MSTSRRSGTVVNTVQCQEGEGVIHEEGEGTCRLYVGGVTGEATGLLVQGSVTSILSTTGNHQCNDIIPLMCCIVQRFQQWCSGQ